MGIVNDYFKRLTAVYDSHSACYRKKLLGKLCKLCKGNEGCSAYRNKGGGYVVGIECTGKRSLYVDYALAFRYGGIKAVHAECYSVAGTCYVAAGDIGHILGHRR